MSGRGIKDEKRADFGFSERTDRAARKASSLAVVWLRESDLFKTAAFPFNRSVTRDDQQLMTLTAKPPRLVSLYLDCISTPV